MAGLTGQIWRVCSPTLALTSRTLFVALLAAYNVRLAQTLRIPSQATNYEVRAAIIPGADERLGLADGRPAQRDL